MKPNPLTLCAAVAAAAIMFAEAAASDAVSPPAKPAYPVLKIGGKENADVYLQSLDIHVDVTGNTASTRYTMVFRNKTDRVLEGELTFPLPDGRSVTYYALDINGKMRDAVPVEKAKATQVFEEIEQRRVDPGLLERVEGNNFRTRVYPIPSRGTRTVSIGYEEELALEKEMLQYRLPMAYPDPIEKFAVKATVWKSGAAPVVPKSESELRFDRADENYTASFARENYRASRALNFSLPAPADIPQIMTRPAQGSHYFFASVAPKIDARKKRWAGDLAIIWDVSLSGSQRDINREMEALDVIFAEKKNVDVYLYFLNNALTKMTNINSANGEHKVRNGNWDALKRILNRATFDGGTDFSKINLNAIAGSEILFFSDGISTLSDADFILNTKVTVKCPIHCVVSSAKADYSAMKLIAGKTKGKFVNLSALSSEELKKELLNETPRFLGTERGEAVREVYPSIATPVRGNFSLAGISDADDAEITLLFGFGGTVEKRLKIRLDAKKSGVHGNVHKLWAQKKIAELDLNYERNRAELTELGQQFGIVTRNTSLIVLETVEDYIRYNIAPPPELRAEYQNRRKGNEERLRDAERSLLREATAAAGKLKMWWDIDFAPKKPKYPTPDSELETSGAKTIPRDEAVERLSEGSERASRRHDRSPQRTERPASAAQVQAQMRPRNSDTKIYANEAREAYESPVATVGPGDVLSILETKRNFYRVRTPSGDEGYVRKNELTKLPEKDVRNKPMPYFEAAEVIGYLDNPAPAYIVDIDDPNADPITLDPGFSGGGVRRSGGGNAGRGGSSAGVWHSAAYGSGFSESASASSASAGKAQRDPAPTITVKPIRKDNDYLNKLTGNTAEDYRLYLKLRDDYASSPTFYFDMADWFYTHNDKKLALRVLTSIADLDLENALLYRLLGYRLKEYGEYALEKFVCQKVIQWRPMEPQSYRDYALALADNGEAQAALDSLYALLTKTYSDNIGGRSRGIEEVVITEMNRLIAKTPNLNTSKIDAGVIADIPVDIRVVINWNMNNTDIDLHVKDPNGEECYYGRRETKIGGRISADNTNGYGPEQFLLKKAVKGKYRVYVNYFSDTQAALAGPSTVMAEIFTKYAGKTEQRRVVCLQMSNVKVRDGLNIEVAEFEF